VRARSEAPGRILEAAIAVIEDGGEVAIRVHDIAASCGVTGPILYRAFGSREGLIVAAQAERYRRCTGHDINALAEAIDGAATVAELRTALDAELRTAFEADRGRDRRVRANIVGSCITRPDLAAAIVDIDRSLAERAAAAWERAQRRGIVRTDIDPSVLASWWMAHLDSRVRIELAPTRVDGNAWNQLARTAALAAVFGSAA
jgi:AcrR family transcriptional regulator